MEFSSFLADILATIVGGISLTCLFFVTKEKIFPIPDITGRWYIEVTTINSAYRPYDNMVLRYVIMIWREGNILKGSAEKIYENSLNGEQEYVGIHRTRALLEGYFEKNYLSRDKVCLHAVEKGHGRESTNFYELIVNSKLEMTGKFQSMVADQDGTVRCQKEPF
ncbi:hypothetical protein QL886_09050 [Psychrobacter sp. APC 3281]|uniref:hypothetical protein n=1 Tax=Psychrobacter sp. APC 3281 TaxID=3035190 RepID=UPI0025B53B03|nr:hypothetical protein [Psychrobacter sp. APC 3281]MDN3447782.1 hypothetical protein [Psychrobacter sp. APC 3281]